MMSSRRRWQHCWEREYGSGGFIGVGVVANGDFFAGATPPHSGGACVYLCHPLDIAKVQVPLAVVHTRRVMFFTNDKRHFMNPRYHCFLT